MTFSPSPSPPPPPLVISLYSLPLPPCPQASILGEISVRRGETVEIVEEVSTTRWQVRNKFGGTGHIPSQNAEILPKKKSKGTGAVCMHGVNNSRAIAEGWFSRLCNPFFQLILIWLKSGGLIMSLDTTEKIVLIIGDSKPPDDANTIHLHGKSIPAPPKMTPPPVPGSSHYGNRVSR